MGTNYAVKGERFQNLEDGELHIGKRSAGWVFAFQSQNFVDPRTGIEYSLRSFDDYVLFLRTRIQRSESIVDEYGNELSAGYFLSLVEKTRGEQRSEGLVANAYHDHGFDFYLEDFC